MNKQAETQWALQARNLGQERAEIRAKIDGHRIAMHAQTGQAMRDHHERMIKNLQLALANLAN